MAAGWATPPAPGECVVWWATPRPWQPLAEVLDAGERGRLDALRRADDRARFTTGAWLLRTVAASALGTDPGAVQVDRTCPDCDRPHGRPRVLGPAGESLRTSVTHAGDAVGVAVAWADERPLARAVVHADGCGLGLDVEPLDACRRLAHLTTDVLAPAELSWLPPEEPRRSVGLVRRWVAKEASLKAVGVGLRVDLRTVELAGGGDDRLRLARWPLEVPPAQLHLVDLQPRAEGHTAVLATVGDAPPRVREERVPEA